MAGFKISNDVGATVFAILSGLSALFLTAYMYQTREGRNTNSPKITPVPVATESSADQQEVTEARKALSEESARRAELANELRGSKDDLGSLEEENAILQARLKKLKAAVSANSDLEGKLADLRLKLDALNENNGKLKAQLDTSDATKAKLDASIAGLQTKLKASSEGAGKMGVITAEIAALKLKFDAESKASKEANNALLTLKQSTAEKEKSLLAQIESIKGSMSGDAKSGDAKKVSAELEALKLSSADKTKITSAQLAKLRAEVDALTKKLTLDAKACDAAKKQLLAEINQLNGELDALKNGDKLKRAGDLQKDHRSRKLQRQGRRPI
jgi:chromosome segregation ATPase